MKILPVCIPSSYVIILIYYEMIMKSAALQKMSSEYMLIYVYYIYLFIFKVVMVSELRTAYGPHNTGSMAVTQTTYNLWFLQTELFV